MWTVGAALPRLVMLAGVRNSDVMGSAQFALAANASRSLRQTRAEEAGPRNVCTTDVQTLPLGTPDQVIVESDNAPRSRESSQYPASQSPVVASAHGSPSGASTGIVVGDSKDMRFFGPSAWVPPEFSDLTPGQCTPQCAPKQAFPSKESWSRWTHPSVRTTLERRTTQPLPPWSKAFTLVSEFFEHDHKAVPCLHPPTFMTLLGQQYCDSSEESPAWWVALNAVLAIAQRRRVETGLSPLAEENLAWGYAANAMGATLDVLMRSSCLLSVQGLLTIGWFFIGTPNPQPAFMLIGSAVRLAHTIGLHRNDYNHTLSSIEKEMRNRVFWVAVSLDIQLCLQTGRPPAHDLHDFHPKLPSDELEDDHGTVQAIDGSKVNILRVQAQFALIQARISRELSLFATSKGNSTLSQDCAANLNGQLAEWSSSLPIIFQPGTQPGNEDDCLIKRLHASYHHSVIAVNRSQSSEYWMALDRPATSELTARVMAPVQRCLIAARTIAAIGGTIPYARKELSWYVYLEGRAYFLPYCLPLLFSPSIYYEPPERMV
ncbi:Fungal-trans domain-containing protein [Fusarium sp. LHS14.1]|nr:Fungal-trans domain-containing protein [Fusarium sp. LHS14.1]